MRKRMMSAMLMVMMICVMCVSSVVAKEAKTEEGVTILFTHDMHSHLDSYKMESKKGKDVVMVGGLAKMKTLIDEKRKDNPTTFLLDGGDFSMGTLYQTIYETEASELLTMGKMGYDATTFGNHEFDYRSTGVANMFRAAVKHAEEDTDVTLPAFVSANIDWNKNTSKENKEVRDALEEYGSTPYTVIEHGGVRIGVYGVLGEDAAECAPESGLVFEDIVETSKEMVKKLQKENVDMIVCLSHSGTFDNPKNSEDEILAKEVPEIDVIVSGHTHTKLDEYIQIGDTYVVSSGSDARYLGELELTQKEDGRWEIDAYKLNDLDDKVEEDKEITEELAVYKNLINEQYLSHFDYTFDQVLAENKVAFTQKEKFAEEVKEDPLGSIIADSYVYAVQQAEGNHSVPVAAAIAPSGTIRETLQKGKLTVSDAFNVCSLGIGADRIPGYPLVSVYLTGKELKTAAEIDVSVSPIMTTAQLYPSGMHWTYNSNRMMLNRVTDVELVPDIDQTDSYDAYYGKELEDDKLYRVVAGLYSAQMLGAVEDTSMGLLKVTPKDENGNKIEDFETCIIHNQDGEEVKEWYALASYLESFDKNDEGISEVPVRYADVEGRKTDTDSKNIIELVKKPNKFFAIICGVILLAVVLLILIVRFIVKLVSKWYTKNRAEKKIKDER